jgi:hypothetical protein
VDLREDERGVFISNVTEVDVADLTSTMKQLERGSQKVIFVSCSI